MKDIGHWRKRFLCLSCLDRTWYSHRYNSGRDGGKAVPKEVSDGTAFER